MQHDDYIEMENGIKIPLIIVFDKELDTMLKVAPVQAKRLLEDAEGDILGEEEEKIDEEIFFYADHFVKDEELLKEINKATNYEVCYKLIS